MRDYLAVCELIDIIWPTTSLMATIKHSRVAVKLRQFMNL